MILCCIILTRSLIIYNVGINEGDDSRARLMSMQNYPNPVSDQTSVKFYIPEKELVRISIADVIGRHLYTSDRMLDNGHHEFLFTPPGDGLYLFSTSYNGARNTLKILASGTGNERDCSLEYRGVTPAEVPLKGAPVAQVFIFSPGDELMLIGYGDGLESGFVDSRRVTRIMYFSLPRIFLARDWIHYYMKISGIILSRYLANAGSLKI